MALVRIFLCAVVLLCLDSSGLITVQANLEDDLFQQQASNIPDGNTMENYIHPFDSESEKQLLSRTEKQGDYLSHRNLKIHVLPHSHDDPGWVRTSDQYFDFFVNDIYTTAINALDKDSRRKFQAVEIIYFSQWYDSTSDEQRKLAHKFVDNGQLQFAVGGWAMPDEATTDYTDIIETMTTGHQWLVDTFGDVARPRFGFQVIIHIKYLTLVNTN